MNNQSAMIVAIALSHLYKLFRDWVQWAISLFGICSSSDSILSSSNPKTEQDEYADKYRARFLATFDANDDSAQCWNSNIDAILFDKEALSEILQDANNEIEKKWKQSILIENTPRGNVIMYYDVFKQAFSYYCDQSVMPYDIMNAAAMKYVLTFKCRDFFVDSAILPKTAAMDSSLAPAPDTISSSQPIEKKTEEPKPFAKFKSYNNATKKVSAATEDKTINRFLHLGGVRNWQPIAVAKKINPLNGFKTEMIPDNQKLSYAEYKKRLHDN